LAIVLASPCLAACGRAAGRVEAVSVDGRLDIELSDGRIVRLGGLDTPNTDDGAEEISNSARELLDEKLLGRDADLIQLAGGTDRWGRTVADLVVADPRGRDTGSAAAALLTAGYARVRPEFETRGCATERLAMEEVARERRMGIWRDPEFAVIQSSNSAELRRRERQICGDRRHRAKGWLRALTHLS
jgi:endonuclease YncB( thermonuclease family)